MTLEDCRKVCETNPTFKEKVFEIDGYKIHNFNYMVMDDTLESYPEMRGICFVKNTDGTFKRFLMMKKFFNLNENESVSFERLKDKRTKRVTEKIDGSLIRFIQLPNGRIVAKTIGSVDNVMCETANKILKNNFNLSVFVHYTLNNNICALFELVSKDNKVVIDYNEENLYLLKCREERTGDDIEIPVDILCAKRFNPNTTLNFWIERVKDLEHFEGYVIEFDDGQMVKMKSLWYVTLHRLKALMREDTVFSMMDKWDDYIAQIKTNFPEDVNAVMEIYNTINKRIQTDIDGIQEILVEYTGERKSFAIKYNKHKYFHHAMEAIKTNPKDAVIKFVSKYSYQDFMDWLNT